MPDSELLIDLVVDFYSSFLFCSREQIDLLALWTFHTYCFHHAPFSSALNIHSREKQSGKTTCLQLLHMLCGRASFHTSPSPALVIRQAQGMAGRPFTGTLLLDDCRFTTALQGVLSASVRWSGVQTVRSKNEAGDPIFEERFCYFPKAFAGNQRLPDCLRDVSIPIALEPKGVLRSKPDDPDSSFLRFRQDDNQAEADSLSVDLHQWYEDHAEALKKMPSYQESQFPPELSSRQQDCAEPLLIIADLIGGDWPQRARNALVNAFALSAFEDFHSSKQILADIHQAFTTKGNPAWLSTADVLEFLHAMDDRAWDEWSKGKPMTSKDLGRLLHPFGIKSKNHRTEEGNKGDKDKGVKDKVVKGYSLEAFQKSWHKYLPEQSNTDALSSQAASYANARGSQHPSPEGEIIEPSTSVLGSRDKNTESRRDGIQSLPDEKNSANRGASALSNGIAIPGLLRPVAAKQQNSSPSRPKQAASHANARGSQHPSPEGEIIEPSTSVLGNRDKNTESRRDGIQSLPDEKNSANRGASALSNGVAIPGLRRPVAANVQNSVPGQPKLAASSQQLEAIADSQKAAMVAAMLGSELDEASSRQLEADTLALFEFRKALAERESELQRSARRPVAAKQQNSSPSRPKPAASSQKLGHPDMSS
jgi:hypothetical protein